MMAVEGQDGQQYVVLEVIQLPENSDNNTMQDIKPKINLKNTSPIKTKLSPNSTIPVSKMNSEKKQADIASAFGFDSDDDNDDD